MLIAISGKKQSGKDTTGNIIKILLNSPHLSNEGVKTFLRKEVNPNNFYYSNNWVIKKFADKLKDIVCLLIGCNREQLENEEFKSTPLLEEWWYYTRSFYGDVAQDLIPYIKDFYHKDLDKMSLIKMTPRLMLQLLGTQCCREIIHPEIWVNSLMSEYKPYPKGVAHDLKNWSEVYRHTSCKNCGKQYGGWKRQHLCKECIEDNSVQFYPNWIITDMRFTNEVKSVKQKDGICIRVNRFKEGDKVYWTDTDTTEFPEGANSGVYSIIKMYDKFCLLSNDVGSEVEVPYDKIKLYIVEEHESETALDDYDDWDYIIDNNGTIDELIDKVRRILQAEFIHMKFYNERSN